MLHHRKDAVRPPETVRETQAEAIAYVVCRGIGLETNTAAADYISLYNGDKKTLADSLAVIQETSAKILDELLPEKRLPSVEERIKGDANGGDSERARESKQASPAMHERPAEPAQEHEGPTR